MTGKETTVQTDLQTILNALNPTLQDGEYVFVTTQDATLIALPDVLAHFKEKEGVTLILPRHTADKLQLSYDFIAARITLKVYSSLHAVGLSAACSTALAEQGIACNILAAYHHDHIFVAKEDAERAMAILTTLNNTTSDGSQTTE